MVDSNLGLRALFIVCNNLEGSIQFYKNMGFIHRETKSRSCVLSAGQGVDLHLHQRLTHEETEQYGVAWAPGSSGLVQCYEVDSLEQLAGTVSPESVLYGPLDTPWGDHILVVKDPDGHRLEFRERTA